MDASALCAILLDETEREQFTIRIADAEAPLTSPLAVLETALGLRTKRGLSFDAAQVRIDALLLGGRVRIVSITPDIGRLALIARTRYGKGTGHPAKLNMGDCFAYACAKANNVALLYKGDDLVHTDLA